MTKPTTKTSKTTSTKARKAPAKKAVSKTATKTNKATTKKTASKTSTKARKATAKKIPQAPVVTETVTPAKKTRAPRQSKISPVEVTKTFTTALMGVSHRRCSEGVKKGTAVRARAILLRAVGKSHPVPLDLIAAANQPRAERASHPLAVAYRQEAERMYRAGQSIAQVGHALKMYPVGVEAALEQQGVPFRKEELSFLQTLELGRRQGAGETSEQIAEEMDLPLGLIRSL